MKIILSLLIGLAISSLWAADLCQKNLRELLIQANQKASYGYTKENKYFQPHSLSISRTRELVNSTIEGDNHYSKNLKVFKGHFPGKGNSIFPGVLHFETMVQTARELMKVLEPQKTIADFEIVDAHKIKFSAPILPGDDVQIKAELKNINERGNYEFEASIFNTEGDKVLSSALFTLGKKEKSEHIIENISSKAILSLSKVKKQLPHRAPFLFIDEIREMNSLVNLDADTFNLNQIVASLRVSSTNPVLSRELIDGKEIKLFQESLQIESMAQAAGVLISDYARHYDIKNLKFLLGSIDEFLSFKPVLASDEIVIISRVSKPWKGTINKKAIVELEGRIFVRNTETRELELASFSKSKAFIFPGQ